MLYQYNGGPPMGLPTVLYDGNGFSYTAPFDGSLLAQLGYALAPTKPNDTDTQTVVWNGTGWSYVDKPIVPIEPEPVRFIPTPLFRQRAQKIGVWTDLSAYLAQFPEKLLMVLSLENDLIDPKYPDLLEGFSALQVPQEIQDYLLGDPTLGV